MIKVNNVNQDIDSRRVEISDMGMFKRDVGGSANAKGIPHSMTTVQSQGIILRAFLLPKSGASDAVARPGRSAWESPREVDT